MGYRRNAFGERKIFVLSVVGILAVCAVVGGVLIKQGSMSNKKNDAQARYETTTTEKAAQINNEVEKESTTVEKNTTEIQTTKKNTEKESEISSEKETEVRAEEITTSNEVLNSAQYAEAGMTANTATGLTFSNESTFVWPVNGQVIIDFDMENIVYFPTLDVYKCSDALCIQSDVDTPVYAGANATVLEVGKNDEIGKYVRMSLGGGYEVTYGELKDVQVSSGLSISCGELIGYVAEPTKYYSVEGPNLYIKMTENGSPVDPLEHLNYE